MPKPNQVQKVTTFTGFDDPVFQQHYSLLIDTVNTLAGYNGPIQLSDHLDLNGNRLQNLGTPVNETDALPSGHANDLYAPSVVRTSLESSGANPLKSYRQMNNRSQREQVSSFLNDLMSTPPNANDLLPTITNGTGTVTVSIPPGHFTWADGSFVNTIGRTDILSVPSQYAISSISCSGNVVTVNCAASGLIAGQVGTIAEVTPSVFNGTFTMTSSTSGGAVLTYQEDLGTASGTGGFVQVNGVYYYKLQKRLQALTLVGPFSGDTLQNRIQACFDGGQIVVVVVVTNSGGQISLSGGGGSPIVGSPTAGSFF